LKSRVSIRTSHSPLTSATESPTALDPRRTRLYRLFFALAAATSVAAATLVIALPDFQGYLRAYALVDALLAIAFTYSALRLQNAHPVIAVGLVVKVIAASVWVFLVINQTLPGRTFTLVLLDDVVWWIPFALFLLERTMTGARLRATSPYVCALLNLVAAGALLIALRPGTEVIPDVASRITYIQSHELIWRAGWGCWIAAALSLLAFYAWWGVRLPHWGWGVAALAIASTGLVFDLTAESLLIAWLPDNYEHVAPVASVLTGGLGNGLYTVAGVVLTLGTRGLNRWLLAATWTIWVAGFGLSAFTFAGNFIGVAVCSAVLFALFCPWAVVMGRRRY
jgi:hypothetical protein